MRELKEQTAKEMRELKEQTAKEIQELKEQAKILQKLLEDRSRPREKEKQASSSEW